MAIFTIFKMIMGGLVGKSATLKYPLAPKKTFAATRGHIDIDIEKCIFCGICKSKCPTGAIIVDKAEKTWSIARYDCMQCSRCTEQCPKKCLSMEQMPPEATNTQEYYTVKQAENADA